MAKALVFGGGNIGRGFLGVLLSQSGYQVTFVDVDRRRVDLLNQHRGYPVFVCAETGITEEVVSGIQAMHVEDEERLVDAVCEADVIMTAVGKLALQSVAKPIALGLVERARRRPRDQAHIVVIACENVRDNTAYLAEFIWQAIDPDLRSRVRDLVSFPNCIVDRIVPNASSQSDHPLATVVEDYFQFVIDGSQLQAEFPAISGVEISSNVSARLDQKLFTLNMAHGIVGYYGLLRGYQYVHEAILDHEIQELVTGALEEVEEVVVATHPGISRLEQGTYASKIVDRFRNSHLQDRLSRVASQPRRKLGANERLVRPACILSDAGRAPVYLATGIAAGFHFQDAGDAQARELTLAIAERGVAPVMAEVSGLAPEHPVARAVKADFLLRAL